MKKYDTFTDTEPYLLREHVEHPLYHRHLPISTSKANVQVDDEFMDGVTALVKQELRTAMLFPDIF